jgi:hypothetical protein
MHYTELAKKIRDKHPGAYDDLDDATLAQKIVDKYPAYADTTFEAAAPANAPESSPGVGGTGKILGQAALNTVGGMIPGVSTIQAAVKDPVGVGMIGGGAVGGPGGAILGSMAGDAAQQIGRRLVGNPNVPQTSGEAAKQIGITGAAAALGEVVGPAVGLVKKPIGKGFGKVAEFFSNAPAHNVASVVEKPTTFLPSWLGGPKPLKAAQSALNEAEVKAGLIPAVDEAAAGLAKLKGQRNPLQAESKAREYVDRIIKGEELTNPEKFEAYANINDHLKKASRKEWVLVEARNALQEDLKKLSPEYAKALADAAPAYVRKAVTNILPRTNTGKVSLGRSTFATALGAGAGMFSGDKSKGGLAGLALSSPALYGSTAMGMGAMGAALVNPYTRRLALSAILAAQKKRK